MGMRLGLLSPFVLIQLEESPANGEANGMKNGNHSMKLTSFKNYEVEPTELHHMLPGSLNSMALIDDVIIDQ